MRTEEIERYLTRQMTNEERAIFEKEMQEQPQLAEDVKIVGWTIEAIRERGKMEDADSIIRMREGIGSDKKRYTATAAAVIGGVLIVAAATIASIPPIYRHVIKPIIESVFTSDEAKSSKIQTPTVNTSFDSDSSSTNVDSAVIDADMIDKQDMEDKESLRNNETNNEDMANEASDAENIINKAGQEEKSEDVGKKDASDVASQSQQVAITGQNWTDEYGTKYNPYSLEIRSNNLLVLHIAITNNNSDRDINISEKPKLLDEAGNMHYASKVLFNGQQGIYNLRRTAKAELEIHFNINTNPQRIQYISLSDKNVTQKGMIRNLVIN